MNDIYDLVRRADGKAVYSFPVGGRYLVDTSKEGANKFLI